MMRIIDFKRGREYRRGVGELEVYYVTTSANEGSLFKGILLVVGGET